MNAMRDTLTFIREASMSATINGHGSKSDFLATRIAQCGGSETLMAFGERIAKMLGTDTGGMRGDTVGRFIKTCAGDNAPSILAWLRSNPKIAAMVCFLPSDQFVLTSDEIDVNTSAHCSDDIAAPRGTFSLGFSLVLDAPLAHGDDMKAGNATLFRRQLVMGRGGNVMRLPFYGGNAVRGAVRDILAERMLTLLGLTPSRSQPPLALWFFHSLYAGGALEENNPAVKAAAKRCGQNGSIRAEGIKEFRDMLPGLSALGCAFGNRIISGRAQFADLRPRCREWGTGDTNAASLFDWQYLTRRDDHESHADGDNKCMIANIEVLRAGVMLDGGIDFSDGITPVERSAIVRGITILSERGYIGAQSQQGFGKFTLASIEGMADGEDMLWEKYVTDNRQPILDYLTGIGAMSQEGV